MATAIQGERLHALHSGERLASTTVHAAQIPCTARTSSAAHLLSDALQQEGVSLQQVATACGVGKSRAAAWADEDHEASPNLGHVLRMPSGVRRRIAEGLLALDTHGAAIPVDAIMREIVRVNVRSGQISHHAEVFLACGDAEAALPLVAEMGRLRDHLMRLEQAITAAIRGRR